MRALSYFVAWLLFGADVHAASLPSLSGPANCDTVELSGESLECDEGNCVLKENAKLSCDHIQLRADRIDIKVTSDTSFGGAVAVGNVILLDHSNIIRCQSIELNAGQITGRIDGAVLEVFKNPADALRASEPSPPKRGPGLVKQTIGGNIKRLSPTEFQLQDAHFTLCDCGQDSTPSWRLQAAEINLDTQSRATLWWPFIEFNFLGLIKLPVPAPTPVLSLPVTKRAAGLLAPKLTFMRFPLPILDLPIFIPLGESYDLTIAPGVRSDWGLHKISRPSTWAAPRLGVRLRYAPFSGLQGAIETQWTRDSPYSAARISVRQDTHGGLEDPSLVQLAQSDPRWGLRDRVMLNVNQQWNLNKSLQWNLRGQWVSDDFYQRDFSVRLDEQVSQYLPIRSRLTWHTRHILMDLETSYLQRLNNGDSVNGYKNTNREEAAELQKLPAFDVWLRPLHLGSRIFLSGGLSTRYFTPLGTSSESQKNPEWTIYHQAKVNYLDQLGPFQVNLALVNHLTVSSEKTDSNEGTLRTSAAAYPMLQAQIESHLGRRYKEWVHTVQPYLRARHSLIPSKEPVSIAPDPFLDIPVLHQVELGISQRWARAKGSLSLNISQPVDLDSRDAPLLPTVFALNISGLHGLYFDLNAGLDWEMLEKGPVEIRATTSLKPIRMFKIYGQYGRMASGIQSLSRSIYELSGLTDTLPGEPWVHYLRTGIELSGSKSWKILYQTDVLLPRPGDDSSARPLLSNHLIRTGYQSPCECWGVDLVAQITNPDLSAGSGTGFLDNMTMRVNLTIGDYTLGSL